MCFNNSNFYSIPYSNIEQTSVEFNFENLSIDQQNRFQQ